MIVLEPKTMAQVEKECSEKFEPGKEYSLKEVLSRNKSFSGGGSK